ncbi:unnamed protein product [Cochlearia groenlandica]
MAPRIRKPKVEYDIELKQKKSFFKKIFPGFKKKATELSVLCGNSVGFICYGPDNNNNNDDIHVWPENPQALQRIVSKFNNQSDSQRIKNGCDLKDFTNGYESLSVDEIKNHLSQVSSQLVGVKDKKTEIVSEDHSRVSEKKPTFKDLDSQVIGIKPEETEDHVRVSDKATISACGSTQLGLFGGDFDELGYMFRAHQESVSNLRSNDVAIASVAKDVVGASEPDLVALGFPDEYSLPTTATMDSMMFTYDQQQGFGGNDDGDGLLDLEFLSLLMSNTTHQTSFKTDQTSFTNDWSEITMF